uniref:Ig-like domain-containing protein n=1 Tax=Astyanax mexicanus TaxID=7994 RepID=A0A8B9H1Q7_ASTMX
MWLPLSLLLITETVLGVKVEQSVLFWIKPEGQSAYFNCKVTGLTKINNIHWYQQKHGEAMKSILYADSNRVVLNSKHPDAKDFSVQKDSYSLKVQTLKKSHSAVYYCSFFSNC